MKRSSISVDNWIEVNKRYGAKSARGPDGFDRRDLHWLHPDLNRALVRLVNKCEQLGSWPEVLLQGFVFPLPRRLVTSDR